MSLTNRHLSRHKKPIDFNPASLARALEEACPEAIFAFLLSSSKDGHVSVGSDVDLALFMNGKMSLDLLDRVQTVVERFLPGVHCDIGSLRPAEPVYRFEALKGRLLFTRDREAYLRFFSLTSREYETQLYDYDRQHAYRMKNHESRVKRRHTEKTFPPRRTDWPFADPFKGRRRGRVCRRLSLEIHGRESASGLR